ncbi:hypothetical protein CEXT_279781 [Caerostris extrusa]|uniref:Uncharacterized protein n=1 Tax=Caerostris extrusa TaxID=172846 RepID=A0AAV4N7F6_CAEEX|nr:hypothetical protein CEXT_279781 [Caerostris extrusa]
MFIPGLARQMSVFEENTEGYNKYRAPTLLGHAECERFGLKNRHPNGTIPAYDPAEQDAKRPRSIITQEFDSFPKSNDGGYISLFV